MIMKLIVLILFQHSKEWNGRNGVLKKLLKQWNEGKNVGKNNDQYLVPYGWHPSKGEGKKCKIGTIYLQKNSNYLRLHFRWCNKFGMFLKFEEKNGRNVVQNVF
jgi:hypothetical protein